jgi:hypothetical protein
MAFKGLGQRLQVEVAQVVEDAPAHAGQVGRPRLAQAGEALLGEHGVPAAGVVLALDALHVAVGLELGGEPGHAAQRHVTGLGELAHAHEAVLGLGEVAKNAVLARGHALALLEIVVERAGQHQHEAAEGTHHRLLLRAERKDPGGCCGGHDIDPTAGVPHYLLDEAKN